MPGHSGAMRGRRLLLTNVAVMVAAVVIGWALLVGRDEPAGPDLGPAVQVHLSSTTAAPSRSTPPPTGAPSTTSPTAVAPTNSPAATGSTSSKTPTRVAPSSGAQTVPRHLPMSAGDDGDDHDVDDHDDDDDDDDD